MRPFLAQKSVSLAPAVKPVVNPASGVLPTPLRASPTSEAASPSVDVIKDGGRVVRIVVTCACGQRTEIECIYPPGA